MAGTYYKAGSWNCICQVCGMEYKAEEIKKRWDGLLVCAKDYETRHPADLMRVREEKVGVPYVSREPEDVFIDDLPKCSVKGRSAVPGHAVPGCSTPGLVVTF